MLAFIIRMALSAGALLVLSSPSVALVEVENNSWTTALVVAVVLGLANALVKPILMFVAKALTLPLSCLTLGLWNLVLSWLLSGAIVYGAGALLDGFTVRTFVSAMLTALILAIVNAVASALFDKKDED